MFLTLLLEILTFLIAVVPFRLDMEAGTRSFFLFTLSPSITFVHFSAAHNAAFISSLFSSFFSELPVLFFPLILRPGPSRPSYALLLFSNPLVYYELSEQITSAFVCHPLSLFLVINQRSDICVHKSDKKYTQPCNTIPEVYR